MRSSMNRLVTSIKVLLAAAGLTACSMAAFAGTQARVTADPIGSTAIGKYPGAQAVILDGRRISVFGVPMTGGATPEEAAAAFWSEHGEDFGVADPDLRPVRSNPISNGSVVVAFEQFMGNLPVDGGLARVVVHPDGNRVTYAAARLAREPQGGIGMLRVSGNGALASVRDRAAFPGLIEWSEPTLVIHDSDLAGVTAGHAPHTAMAWMFTGRNADGANPLAFRFFVDATSGRLLEARDMILHVDITGKVEARGTPGVKPDSASNPPVTMPVHFIRVKGPSTVETDILGNYLLPTPGSSAVNVQVGLADGRWVRVIDQSGTSVLSMTQSVTPPGPGNFLLNSAPTEFTTAQVNAFIGTVKIHEYFKTRAPTFTALDTQLMARVNWNSSCNAYFDGNSINFYRNSGGCVNTAYGDVVAHEYGHFIVQQLGLAQNAFGEGYSDSCGVLLHDTGIIGTDFCGVGCHIRNIDTANKQYPCSGGIHDCGQVLAGVWRDLRLKLTDSYGSAPALQVASQIHVDWSLITVGGMNSSNAAWPQTGIEAMTADDDDGNLLNGTPHYADLFYAFGKHGIALPVVTPLSFIYPLGLPNTAPAFQPATIAVDIVDGYEQTIPATAQILYRQSPSDPFTSVPLTPVSGNSYTGTLPGADCGTNVEYRVKISTVETPGGRFDPPSGVHSYVVISSGPIVFEDTFEGTSLFTVSGSISLGTKGRWMQGDPNGTYTDQGVPVAPEHDATPGAGVKCWVTGNGPAGGQASASDVDGVETILTSPVFSLVGIDNPAIAYQRWYFSDSDTDNGNYLIVEISNNNGTTWNQVERVGPGGSGGWVYREFDPTPIVAATASMRVRFRAADATPDHLVEAGVDDFRVFSVQCGCPADFDGSGFLDTDDFDAFVAAFEAGEDDADFDGSGFVDTDDFDAFVVAFIEGC